MNENYLSLGLDQTQDDLQKENLLCAVSLFDSFSATTVYQIMFPSDCFQFYNNGTFNLPYPVPKIRNVNSDGLVTIDWNTDLVVKDFKLRSRRLQFDLQPEDCLSVDLAPGQGDIFSHLRNLSYSFKVSTFESN